MKNPIRSIKGRSQALACVATLAILSSLPAQAGGTLTLKGSPDAPIQIRDHQVEVLIQNGFARTEVTQTFFNPNPTPQEAIYRVPVPENASLSEMTMFLGEQTLQGEVIPRDQARQAYEEEKDSGAGLAEQNDGRVYDFHVSPVPAQGELTFRYLYYQPVSIDTGVGRFHYPLEDGGVDEIAQEFWTQETKVRRSFSFHVEIESAWPLQDIRVPGAQSAAVIKDLGDGRWEVLLEVSDASELDLNLDGDLVVYYRLADNLPGRVEMITHRPDPNLPGTFMMVVTPGIDLQPLTQGVDYVFVLDISGSMSSKLGTLAEGVVQALGKLDAQDRFRIVVFNEDAKDLTRGYWPVSEGSVARGIELVRTVRSKGGTDLFEGLQNGLSQVDADRATNMILVTDGVTNQGIIAPRHFDKLMRSHDVRLFGFLLGNSSNWPLMRIITEASGGFYAPISNADDVIGQIMLAKSKVTHQALHNAELTIEGVHTFDSNLGALGKVYRGEQLITFGRYSDSGKATVELRARLTGEDKIYSTTFEFPEFTEEHPEIERMWALDRIQSMQLALDRGMTSEAEANSAILDLAVAYQLVTEETSMVVLTDEAFQARNIQRNNKDRVRTERQAATAHKNAPVVSRRVDTQQPAFTDNAPRLGGNGGGAFGPLAAGLAALLAGAILAARRKRNQQQKQLAETE